MATQTSKFATELLARIPYSKNIIDNITKLNPKYETFEELTRRKVERLASQSVVFGQPSQAQHPLQGVQGTLGGIMQNMNFAEFMYANCDMNDKVRRLQDYRKMSSYSELSDAIDEICDDCIVYNTEDNSVIQFDMTGEHNREMKQEITKEWRNFIQYLQLEDKGWEYFRQFLIDGEIFFENIISQNRPDYGILGLMNIPAELITPIFDNVQNDIIKGFMLRKPIKSQDPKTIEKEQMVLMEPQQVTYVHSGIWNSDRSVRLPYIEAARRPYKQLSLIEDAIIIYRLVRAPERLIFNVEVGNMNAPQAESYLKRLMHSYWSKKTFDFAGNGGAQNAYNPQSMLDAFWFAKRNGQASTEVTTLPGGCLAMDTMIPLLDGRKLSLAEMTKEYNDGKQNWIYSCDPKTGRIVPGKVDWAGVTQKSAKVMKLSFDNGEDITCTLDHKFPTINRGKLRADELNVGDSIYSFNTQMMEISRNAKHSRYECVYQHDTKKWEFTHRMVVRFLDKFGIIKNKIYNESYVSDVGGFDTIHHNDISRTNNSPENLVLMNSKDHFKMHGEMSNPEISKKISSGIKKFIKSMSPEAKEIRAKQSRKNFKLGTEQLLENERLHPELKVARMQKTKEALRNICNTPEKKAYMSKRSVEIWENPKHQKKMQAVNRDRWADPNNKAKLREAMSLIYSEESLRKLIQVSNETNIVNRRELVAYLNANPDNAFTAQFMSENVDKCGWNCEISNYTINTLIKKHGYNNYVKFRTELKLFNHKVVGIEMLNDEIEVGTLTIDKHEKYHNYHTFATCCGVMTYNSNLGELQDLLFFQRKLYKSLKIPLSRMDPANVFSDGTTITREELKFASFVMRIQRNFAMGIKNSFVTHLKLRKLWHEYGLKETDVSIKFNTPTSFGVMREQQVFAIKLENFNNLSQNESVSNTFCLRYYLGFNDSQIKENRAWLRNDAGLQWELEQIRASGPNFQDSQDSMKQAEADIAGGGAGGAGGSGFAPEVPPDFGPGPETAPAEAPAEAPAGGGAPAGAAPAGAAPTA